MHGPKLLPALSMSLLLWGILLFWLPPASKVCLLTSVLCGGLSLLIDYLVPEEEEPANEEEEWWK